MGVLERGEEVVVVEGCFVLLSFCLPAALILFKVLLRACLFMPLQIQKDLVDVLMNFRFWGRDDAAAAAAAPDAAAAAAAAPDAAGAALAGAGALQPSPNTRTRATTVTPLPLSGICFIPLLFSFIPPLASVAGVAATVFLLVSVVLSRLGRLWLSCAVCFAFFSPC